MTCVVLISNTEPDEGAQTTPGGVPLSSWAATENVTTAPLPLVASAVILEVGSNVGAVLSSYVTVTVKLFDPVLVWLSVAVQVTSVDPMGKASPEL